MTGPRNGGALLLLLLAAGGGGCGTGTERAPAAAATEAAAPVPVGAVITVRAVHAGPPVAVRPLKMDSDPICAAEHSSPVRDPVVVEGPEGELANVVAWIAEGVPGGPHPTPTEPVLLDQRGCLYHPHVLTLMTGQPLVMRNSDPTLHNVHGFPRLNREFNFATLKGAKESIQTFTAPEIGFKVKCDCCSWMEGWISVFDHPFHGVTGADGKIAMPRVPAGTYTVSVWHEYGRFTTPDARSVTVKDGESVEVAFTFEDRERKPR